MSRSIRKWMSEGETLYTEAVQQYQVLQSQIEQLEARIAEKRMEVNQIAHIIGKPPVEGPRKLAAQLIEGQPPPPGTVGAVTRALTGRGVVPREPPPAHRL